MISAARVLRDKVDRLDFGGGVARVYNPLKYAWRPHEAYVRRWGASRKRVIFVGMNPGPWGMAQTGVPFGDVTIVTEWLGIRERVDRPPIEHPSRPIQGFDCKRSEVSGTRLWGLFRKRFGTAEKFFEDHFVANYCPLAFMEASGRNVTPDKLRGHDAGILVKSCDRHLRDVIEILGCEWVIGVGKFAQSRILAVRESGDPDFKVGCIPHPSPVNPAANRGWSKLAEMALIELGVWRPRSRGER